MRIADFYAVGGKERPVFNRPAEEGLPGTSTSALTLSSASREAHQLQGHLYCAALNVFRAAQGVLAARELDYLYSALSNLEDLAVKGGIAEADVAEIAQWRREIESRTQDARRREAFEVRGAMPIVQLEAVDLHAEELREIA